MKITQREMGPYDNIYPSRQSLIQRTNRANSLNSKMHSLNSLFSQKLLIGRKREGGSSQESSYGICEKNERLSVQPVASNLSDYVEEDSTDVKRIGEQLIERMEGIIQDEELNADFSSSFIQIRKQISQFNRMVSMEPQTPQLALLAEKVGKAWAKIQAIKERSKLFDWLDVKSCYSSDSSEKK